MALPPVRSNFLHPEEEHRCLERALCLAPLQEEGHSPKHPARGKYFSTGSRRPDSSPPPTSPVFLDRCRVFCCCVTYIHRQACRDNYSRLTQEPVIPRKHLQATPQVVRIPSKSNIVLLLGDRLGLLLRNWRLLLALLLVNALLSGSGLNLRRQRFRQFMMGACAAATAAS